LPALVTTIVRTVIAGLGLVSLVGVPTQHPATMLSAGIVVFFVIATTRQHDRGQRLNAMWWIAAFAVATTTAAGQLVAARTALRTTHRAIALGVPYRYGMAPPEGLSSHGEMRWIESGALAVRPIEGRFYELTFWHPRPGAASPPVEVRVTLDGREVLRRAIPPTTPESFYLETPRGRRSFVLEFNVSPANQPHALGVAQQWHDTLPSGVTAAQVIR
jgi:hypothetical protein